MTAARPSNGRLYLLLALMLLLWSFNYIVGKVALREFPPVLLAALRNVLAGILIIPLYLCRQGGDRSVWSWRELRLLVPLGLCGVALNQLFFILGLSRTSVAHTGIINALAPMLVLMLAAALGQERISPRKIAGMGIALGGIVVLQLGRVQGSNVTLLGDFFVLLGALSFAAFTVIGKSVTLRHRGLTVNMIAYVSGAICMFPLILWQGPHFHFDRVSALGWCSIFYMAAFSSIAAYLIYYYALTYIAASRVSGFSYLQPLVATLMAVPLLREPVSSGLLLGGSLALAGVYVTERT